MNQPNEMDMEMAGYKKVYDYSQYAHENHVNVIPEKDFKNLVSDTFKTIADILRSTYGPYGSSVIISDQGETTTTKDGYNVFNSIKFNHAYKHMVYQTIKKIITRVNRNVGDGTTSCILLAEKIFNNLNKIIETPDQKRHALSILTDIEEELQDSTIIDANISNGVIKRLDKTSILKLINLAANYDINLATFIYTALDPKYDDNGNVVSVRNVIPTSEIVQDSGSMAKYSFDFMPGDYRMTVDMGVDDISRLATPTKLKCVVYDHAFNSNDWINFRKNYKNEPTIIIARTFARGFLVNDYSTHLKQLEAEKRYKQGDGVNNIILCWVKGEFIQHEIQDIANLLGTEARDIHSTTVDHDELPTVNVQVYKSNCLVFYDVPRDNVESYCNRLTEEIKKDTTHSYVKLKEYKDRIKALRMESKDTLMTIKCGSSLESKLIEDKIDDCISIVNSACTSGIVPNILRYAYDRVCKNLLRETHIPIIDFEQKIRMSIADAIKGLFADIWESKYGNKSNPEDAQKIHYDEQSYTSFDVISGKSVPTEELPTSTQYDLEVVVASLSIVKYLLTGRALIFDANILPQINDDGHYAIN